MGIAGFDESDMKCRIVKPDACHRKAKKTVTKNWHQGPAAACIVLNNQQQNPKPMKNPKTNEIARPFTSDLSFRHKTVATRIFT